MKNAFEYESELAALREELAELGERYAKMQTGEDKMLHRIIAERDAAEQRNAEQLKLIAGLVQYADGLLTDVNNAWSYAGSTGAPEAHKDSDYSAAVALIAALPTESASSACTSCDGSGEYIDAIGDWRGYCSCPAGIALKNKPTESGESHVD